MAALEDVPGAGDEKVLTRVDEAAGEVRSLDRPRIALRLGKRLGGVVVEFLMVSGRVMEDDLVWPTGWSNRLLGWSRAPLGGRNNPELGHCETSFGRRSSRRGLPGSRGGGRKPRRLPTRGQDRRNLSPRAKKIKPTKPKRLATSLSSGRPR